MENDITSMQQEAANRVREMQRRAREKIRNTEDFQKKENETFEKEKHLTDCVSNNYHNNKVKGKNLLEMLNFKSLLKGNDTSIVVAILLMLSADDVDPMLILALIYIVM